MVTSTVRDNLDKAVNISPMLYKIPNEYGLINKLGLFQNIFGSQKLIEIPRLTEEVHTILDRNWDERNQSTAGEKRESTMARIPHFPLDDAITANDIDGKYTFESFADLQNRQLETVANIYSKKSQRLRKAHAKTLELARFYSLITGKSYAPNGTVSYDWYDEWGVTRKATKFDFSNSTNVPNTYFEDQISFIQENLLTGQTVDGFVCLCGKNYFNGLIANPYIREGALNIHNPQNNTMIMGRLVANRYNLDARYRSFDFAGITFIQAIDRYVDPTGAEIKIGDDDAILIPTGVEGMFRTHYAPANRLDCVNQTASELYMFQFTDEKLGRIELMSESNFLNVITEPQVILKLTNGK